MRQPLLGVLGGMGPLATAHFYRTLVELTPAALDQDHLPVVIWADPSVPDRTRALVGHGPSPLPSLLKGLRHLECAGASLIVIPCNTAHAYLGALRAAADVEILDMPSQVLAQAEPLARRTGRIGLLATRGTRYAGVYEQAARTRGVTIHNVSQATQTDIVDRAIAAVNQAAILRRPGVPSPSPRGSSCGKASRSWWRAARRSRSSPRRPASSCPSSTRRSVWPGPPSTR